MAFQSEIERLPPQPHAEILRQAELIVLGALGWLRCAPMIGSMTTQPPKNTGRITLKTLYEQILQMDQMQRVLIKEIVPMRQGIERLENDMQVVKIDLKKTHKVLESNERRVNVLYIQSDSFDARLDDLEVNEIPKIKKALKMR